MAIGTVLVLASWLALSLLLIGAGIPLSVATTSRLPRLALLRVALWWGTALVAVLVLGLGAAAPLGSSVVGLVVGVALLSSAALGLLLLHRARPRGGIRRLTASLWLVMASLVLMVVYLAFKALGPATNYDTGLYHLGLIRYLADFGTIPGLANLFLPFGYANAQFPLASALTSGPWSGDGWRLLNGLIVVLVVFDLGLRLLQRRWTWGTYSLLVGVAAVSLPLVAMADALVASPTADTSVLLLTLVSAAYLCDLLARGRDPEHSSRASGDIIVMSITTGLAIAMRPTMLAYAGALAVVVVLVMWRRRASLTVPPRTWAPVGIWLLVLAGVQVYRDYLLSGWVLYPLSLFAWDVPWLARDPEPLRDATLAAARDPYAADGYVVAHSWTWIDDWIIRLPTQWETWFIAVGLVVTIIVVLTARTRAGSPTRPKLLALALAPSVLSLATWFALSPPSFRFIWGPLFVLPFIVIGAALEDLAHAGSRLTWAPAAVGLTIVAVTVYSLGFRSMADSYTETGSLSLGPVSIPYAVSPVPVVPTRSVTMIGGLVVREPAVGDQCWAAYPLCTFSMGDRIGLLGEGIGEGFVTLRPTGAASPGEQGR